LLYKFSEPVPDYTGLLYTFILISNDSEIIIVACNSLNTKHRTHGRNLNAFYFRIKLKGFLIRIICGFQRSLTIVKELLEKSLIGIIGSLPMNQLPGDFKTPNPEIISNSNFFFPGREKICGNRFTRLGNLGVFQKVFL